MIDVAILKEIARNRIQRQIKTEEDLIDMLRVWWSNKFSKPDNHPLFLAKTLEEHMIDYFTDKFINNPDELKKPSAKQLEEREAKIKEEMGDEYREEYDYLDAPTPEQLKGATPKPPAELPPDIEDDFVDVRTTRDHG